MGPHFRKGLIFISGVLGDRSDSVLKDLVILGFTTSGGSDQHESVTDLDRIIQLKHFPNKDLGRLEIECFATGVNGDSEASIINDWLFNAWEEIFDDIFKEWQIILQELGDVDISEGPQEELLFIHIGFL